MSYAIEIQKERARLVDIDGRSREVEFYLHTESPPGNRAETLSDRLNDPSLEFIPCDVDGRTSLFRLASIAYVELESPPAEFEAMEQIGIQREAVRLELVNGETLVGEAVYSAPQPASRVSDLLNTPTRRFLFVVSEGRTLVVQRQAVARIEL
jgi:hypothetical protein